MAVLRRVAAVARDHTRAHPRPRPRTGLGGVAIQLLPGLSGRSGVPSAGQGVVSTDQPAALVHSLGDLLALHRVWDRFTPASPHVERHM